MIKLYKIIGLIFFIINMSCLGMDFNTITIKDLLDPASYSYIDKKTMKSGYNYSSFLRAANFVRSYARRNAGTNRRVGPTMNNAIKNRILQEEDRKFVDALVDPNWKPIHPDKLVKDMLQEEDHKFVDALVENDAIKNHRLQEEDHKLVDALVDPNWKPIHSDKLVKNILQKEDHKFVDALIEPDVNRPVPPIPTPPVLVPTLPAPTPPVPVSPTISVTITPTDATPPTITIKTPKKTSSSESSSEEEISFEKEKPSELPQEKKSPTSPQNSSSIDSLIKRISGGYLNKGCSFIASFLKQQGYERMSDFFYSNIPIRVAFASIIIGISAGAYALYKNKKANIDIPENNTAQDSNDDQIDDETESTEQQ